MAKSKAVKEVSRPKPQSNISKPKKSIKGSVILKKLEKSNEAKVYPGSLVSNSNPQSFDQNKMWNLKLVSWNVNGLRASIKRKALNYLAEENADVVALQETKCADVDLPAEAKDLKGYKAFMLSAKKSGYSGTAVYSKVKPLAVTYGIGKDEHDQEGRVITTEFEGFYFVNAYVPNSGRGLVRLDYRHNSWDRDFAVYLKGLDDRKPVIVCGDLNVSHEDIDLANPKSNAKTAGFTKEERAGFSKLLSSVGLVDSFRHIYPDRREAYTFWSYMGNARARNIGWRLDYFLISKRLLPNLCDQELRTEVEGSDHCPLVLYMNM